MQPSQRNQKSNHTPDGQKKLMKQVISNTKTKNQQLLKEPENSQKDSKKNNSKLMQPGTNQTSFGPQIDSLIPKQRSFAPFVANTLEVEGKGGISYVAVTYNEKHDMIIACPRINLMRFYDATTLLPVKEIRTERLEAPAMVMPFSQEKETFVLGCQNGHIYTYSLSSKILQKVRQVEGHIMAMAFIDSKHYAFSALQSQKLWIGNLENGDLMQFDLGNNNSSYLESLPEKKLLFSSLKNGSLLIYRTDQLPRLPALYSVPGYSGHNSISIAINGKELFVTKGSDCKIKIWQLLKGRMRLLKVIPIEENIVWMVYLENYKMLATTYNTQFIKFFSLPSGKLEHVINAGMGSCWTIFSMKDKNCVGVPSSTESMIKIIQLHGGEKLKEKKNTSVQKRI